MYYPHSVYLDILEFSKDKYFRFSVSIFRRILYALFTNLTVTLHRKIVFNAYKHINLEIFIWFALSARKLLVNSVRCFDTQKKFSLKTKKNNVFFLNKLILNVIFLHGQFEKIEGRSWLSSILQKHFVGFIFWKNGLPLRFYYSAGTETSNSVILRNFT